jgi:hypothetical protein
LTGEKVSPKGAQNEGEKKRQSVLPRTTNALTLFVSVIYKTNKTKTPTRISVSRITTTRIKVQTLRQNSLKKTPVLMLPYQLLIPTTV